MSLKYNYLLRLVTLQVVLSCALPMVLVAEEEEVVSNKGGSAAWHYDPSHVDTVTGQVLKTKRLTMGRDKDQDRLIVMIRGEDGIRTEVHVGPIWFIERKGVNISKGNMLEVSGTKAVVDGQPVIVAGSVTIDGKVIRLRDPSGSALWNAWKGKN